VDGDMSFYDFPKHLLDLQAKQHERYWHDAGNYMLIGQFKLDHDSVVIDVGGYKGNFTASILDKYNCIVDVYEPVKTFAEDIEKRFYDNKWVTVHNYALEDRDYTVPIAGMDEGSSIFFPCDKDAEKVEVRDVVKEIYGDADLLALNGEGCEYPVLERLIETGKIKDIKNILVQFHIFVPGAENRRNKIREELNKTHKEMFCYDFCWEAWTLK
jgi:FkbM family methyltransferase